MCGAGMLPRISTHMPHQGEEPPISGKNGSGTIFFSQCSMKCVYCQNHSISQKGEGAEESVERLVEMMLELKGKGCHNVNFVTPTHYAASVISAVEQARAAGFDLPIVYNSGGYDSVELIEELEGIVDIYLVDMRYASDAMAKKYSGVPYYVQINRAAAGAMFKQAGNLVVADGMAKSGMIVRLLILPGDISGTVETLEYICESFGTDVHLSVMSQFYPAWRANEFPELSKRISRDEYDAVTDKLEELGMSNGWLQPFEGGDTGQFAGEIILGR